MQGKNFRIQATLGHRFLLMTVDTIEELSTIVYQLIGPRKYKWISERTLSLLDGALIIESDDMEEAIECERRGTLETCVASAVHRFEYGHWKNSPVRPSAGAGRRVVTTGGVTLKDMCLRHGWDARRARAMLRKEGRGGRTGSWVWNSDEAEAVEGKLKEYFS